MTVFYVGMAQGKVAHIRKRNSLVKRHGYDDYYLTMCGRHIPYNWFENGIDPYGVFKPDYIPLCKKCEDALKRDKS